MLSLRGLIMEKAYYDNLYEKYKGLVPFTKRKYNIHSSDDFIDDELFAAGYEGLSKACYEFDPNKGFKFTTFATQSIKNSILLYLRSNQKHSNNISLNSKAFLADDESELEKLDELENPCQQIKDDRQIDLDNIDNILAALVTYANVKDQEIFIKCNVLGMTQDKVAKQYNYSRNSAISRRLIQVKTNILKIISYMEKNKNAPNKKDFKTKKEWRKAYAEFYIKHKEKAKFRNYDLKESDLIEKIFR